jgi:hypothetical protein
VADEGRAGGGSSAGGATIERDAVETGLNVVRKTMTDIQRQRLKSPLLGCHRMVGRTEASVGAGVVPDTVGASTEMERGSNGRI